MHAGVFGPGMLTTPQARTLSTHASLLRDTQARTPHPELSHTFPRSAPKTLISRAHHGVPGGHRPLV